MPAFEINQRVNLLDADPQPMIQNSALFTGGDHGSFVWTVRAHRNNVPQALSGGVEAYFTRFDGIKVHSTGSVTGDAAHVTIPAQALAVQGPVAALLRVGDGEAVQTLAKLYFNVDNAIDGDVTGEVVLLLQDVLDTMDELESWAEKLENIAVAVVTLPPGSPGTGSMTQTEDTTTIHIGIPQGPEGEAATFTIVQTITGEPGSQASITEAEDSTAQNRKYILAIPTGTQGPQGTTGTIQIVQALTGEPGTQASISESSDSTTQNRRYILAIPRGDKGEIGDPTNSTAVDIPARSTGSDTNDSNVQAELGKRLDLTPQTSSGNIATIQHGIIGIPLDVSVDLTATQDANVQSPNLWQPDPGRPSSNGLTMVVAADGSVTFDGIATDFATFTLLRYNPIPASNTMTYRIGAGNDLAIGTDQWLRDTIQMMLLDVDGNIISETVINCQARLSAKNFTLTKDAYYLQIIVGANAVLPGFSLYPLLTNDGSSAFVPFVPDGKLPYYPEAIHPSVAGGENVGVVRCGKNLWKKYSGATTVNGIAVSISDDGTITLNGANTSAATFNVNLQVSLPEDTYTISANNPVGIGQAQATTVGMFIQGPNGSVNYGSAELSSINAMAIKTVTGKIGRLQFYVRPNTYNNFVIRPQLEPGSTATAYEPYQGDTYPFAAPSDMWGLPGAQDGLKIGADGVVSWVRRTEMLVLNGTEAWRQISGKSDCFYFAGAYGSRTNTSCICSHYPVSGSASQTNELDRTYYRFSASGDNASIYAPLGQFADVAAFSVYLAALYAAGTPVQVLYELATPITETLPGIYIPALAGVNNIYSDKGPVEVALRVEPGRMAREIIGLEERVAALEAAIGG